MAKTSIARKVNESRPLSYQHQHYVTNDLEQVYKKMPLGSLSQMGAVYVVLLISPKGTSSFTAPSLTHFFSSNLKQQSGSYHSQENLLGIIVSNHLLFLKPQQGTSLRSGKLLLSF